MEYSDVEFIGNQNQFVIGSIILDPMFIDIEQNDFHLQSGSPCIDAGDPSVEYNDFDGTRNDMGAYGGPQGNW